MLRIRQYLFHWIALVAIVSATSLVATPAKAATPLGQVFTPNGALFVSGFTYVQCLSPPGTYEIPSAGVITAWSFQADSTTPTIKLKVARPTGNTLEFTVIGESPVKVAVANQLNSYSDVRIPVAAGDLLGLYTTSDDSIMRIPSAGFNVCRLLAPPGQEDVAPGTTSPAGQTTSPTAQLDVSAVLEPDADGDGFGDETQDGCPTEPAVQGPCPDRLAPETTIEKQPKDKTKKRKARFAFSSNEVGGSFECSLDKGKFSACGAKAAFRVKRGKHSLEVRAIDAAGNPDATPAADAWKVKRKKKR